MKKCKILWLSIALLLCGCQASVKPEVSKGEPLAMYQCARETLSKSEKAAYDAMIHGYLEMKKEIVLQDIDVGTLNDLIAAITMDHPEVYYLMDDFDYEINDDHDTTYFIYHPKYRFSKEKVDSYNKQIEKNTKDVIAKAKQQKDDYEKVKYVYDYIIEHTAYDEVAIENQNILSTFLYNKTVCAGYAKGVQYLLNRIDVPCTYLTGFVRDDENNESHAWNLVEMNGNYYYLDATSGDMEEKTKELRYMYFGMSKDEMLTYNRPFTNDYIKETPSRKDTYYTRSGAYFTTADMKQMRKLINTQLQHGSARFVFQCENDDIASTLYDQLVDTNLIFEMSGRDYYDYYSYDEFHTSVFIPANQEL